MEEKLIGRITHYFTNIGVAVVELTDGKLSVGDKIHIKGATSDFEQMIDSMQIEHESVEKAKKRRCGWIKKLNNRLEKAMMCIE